MRAPFSFARFRGILFLLTASLIIPLVSCVQGDRRPLPANGGRPVEEDDMALIERNRGLKKEVEACKQEFTKLKSSLDDLERSNNNLERDHTMLQLRLFEKDTQIQDLKRQQASLQEQLTEAIQEVVRAKAKLRSLESRAEAASNMAETEIALKALRKQKDLQGDEPSIAQAEQLLKMSYREFEKENYGGALYLAGQAKAHLKNVQLRAKDEGREPLPGETPFSIAVPLQVVTTSNLRKGPGLNFEVLSTLKPNTAVLAYSSKGEWIYVKTESGLRGWIFQNLVRGR